MSDKRISKKQIIADLILVFVILTTALSVYLFVESSREAGSYAEVLLDGGRVAKFANIKQLLAYF